MTMDIVEVREGEMIEPPLSIDEKLRALASKSLDVVLDKLSVTQNPDTALKALEVTSKALGYGARQRRMIESDLAAGDAGNPREVAIARRSITQEAIRLAAAGQIQLKEKVEEETIDPETGKKKKTKKEITVTS